MQGLANVGGHEVVANYSRKRQRARKFAQEWSIPEPTIELNKLIGRSDIDLYVIAVPNEEHLPVSLALSRAKRNQVCTKPLARTPAEAYAMLKAARSSAALHGYAETEVFSPCVVKAQQVVAKGGVGKVLWVRSRESHGGPHSPHFWDREKTGGGAMHDLGCHCISAARFFSARTIPSWKSWHGEAASFTRRLIVKTTPCCFSSSRAAESAIVNSRGRQRAGLIFETRYMVPKAPSSRTSPEGRPSPLSQHDPSAT